MISAVRLLQGLAAGAHTAREITAASLQAIKERDGKVHAFISLAPDSVEQASASDTRRSTGHVGTLEGLPIAIKDNIDVAGLPTSIGIAHYSRRVAATDAAVVAALRAAGAIIIGKLNMHEGALGATTDNPFFGRCDNPLAPGHTPGGSSGGSAAALAAGFVPLTLGTDTMGSVRIPAAYCGLFGLKPTPGCIATAGLHFLSPTLDCIGPMAASAEDLSLITNVLLPPDSDINQSTSPLASLSFALPFLPNTLLEPDVETAFGRLCGRLQSRGIKLKSTVIAGWDPGRLRRAGLLVCEAEGNRIFGRDLQDAPDGFSASFRAMMDYGAKASPERVASALDDLAKMHFACLEVLQDVDALLLPTAPQRPFAHGAPVPANQADLTALANAAGLPAVAFPLPAPDAGLPCSAQLIGRPNTDRQLVALAGVLHRIAHDP